MTSSGLLDALVGALPYRPALLRAAARLPPALRSRHSFRLLSATARLTPSTAWRLDTNLGISSRLHCQVPAAHSIAAFGKPTLYAGERASLELAARFARRCDAFLDVGAHLGYFTFFVRAQLPSEPPI